MVLYNSSLTNLHNLTGDQIGAYFGYSIATCDINGDNLDDILIGAPMWTDYSVTGKFETGKVYVVYQTEEVRIFLAFDSGHLDVLLLTDGSALICQSYLLNIQHKTSNKIKNLTRREHCVYDLLLTMCRKTISKLISTKKSIEILRLTKHQLLYCLALVLNRTALAVQNKFGRKWDSLNGENHKARFGMSIASLGNLNLDGVTAGSPGGYQGESGHQG